MAPPPIPMPVFTAQPEVLGYVAANAARAVINVYAAIPGINRICEDLQRYHERRPTLSAGDQNREDEHQARNMADVDGLLTVLIADCEDVLSFL